MEWQDSPTFKILIPFLLLIGSTQIAHAYIPPADFILNTWAKKHAGVKSVRVITHVALLDGDKPSASTQFKEITSVDFKDGTLRSWARDDQNRDLYRSERKLSDPEFFNVLLFEANGAELSKAVKAKGIPAEMESLARLKNGLAWVIGDKSKDDAQIWFEKDTFLPLRVLVSSPSDIDVQFDGFKFQHEFPYPKVTRVLKRGGSPIFVDELTEISVNTQTIEEKIPLTSGYTDQGNSAGALVRDLIKVYYEDFR